MRQLEAGWEEPLGPALPPSRLAATAGSLARGWRVAPATQGMQDAPWESSSVFPLSLAWVQSFFPGRGPGLPLAPC